MWTLRLYVIAVRWEVQVCSLVGVFDLVSLDIFLLLSFLLFSFCFDLVVIFSLLPFLLHLLLLYLFFFFNSGFCSNTIFLFFVCFSLGKFFSSFPPYIVLFLTHSPLSCINLLSSLFYSFHSSLFLIQPLVFPCLFSTSEVHKCINRF